MTSSLLNQLVIAGGIGQLSILIASAMVPFQLHWNDALKALPKLHRQMYWTYGGYVVLAITAFGVISMVCSHEIAAGTPLARAFCGYVCVFWLIRLCLQLIFDVRQHLTAWWLTAGYHTLTVMFVGFAGLYGWIAVAR